MKRIFSINSGCKGSLPQDFVFYYFIFDDRLCIIYSHSCKMWISSTSAVLVAALDLFLK